MFIRESVTRKKEKKYIQHHLVKSFRTSTGPRQKLVLNLGIISIPKDQWKELANAIEDKLLNRKSLFAINPKIQELAIHYSQIISNNKIIEEKENCIRQKKDNPEYIMIDINSFKNSQNKTIGTEQIMLQQMKEYDCNEIFSFLTNKERDFAKILIAGRAIHPSSERETVRWANENSGICELLNTKSKVYDNGLHRTAIKLWNNKEVIEKELTQKAKTIFSLKENVVLYDLTNTYFEGSMRNSKIAKPGRSKERRNDRPLITLALRADEDGFPKTSKIYKGNVGETKTLKEVLKDITQETPLLNIEKTIVMDAGIASEENLELIKKEGFHYLVVSRKKSYEKDFWKDSKQKTILLQKKNTILQVRLRKTENESFLLCHSKDKEKKENAIFQKKLKNFEKELQALSDGLKKKRTKKQYTHILERIGRLRERYGISYIYDIEVQHKKNIATKIIYTKNNQSIEKEKYKGQYVIRTSRIDLNEEEISKLHRSLTQIESSFKSMKSHLGLRPIFHKVDVCIKAHIFITVIAYHIISAIQKKLFNQGYHHDWTTIRNILSGQIRITNNFNTKNNETIYIRENTNLTAKQAHIFRLLSFNHRSLGTKRTIIKSHTF